MTKRLKTLGLISLFFAIPSLMAYTRTPYSCSTNDYYDIEVKTTLLESDPEKTYDLYEFTVKNTGKGYVIQGGTYACYYDGGHVLINGESTDPLFNSALLAKGAEYTFTQSVSKEKGNIALNPSYKGTAYVEPGGNISFSGSNAISQYEGYNNLFVIDSVASGLSNDYEYVVVVTIEYEDIEHCITCSIRGSDNKIYFSSKDGSFDYTKATIKEVIGFEVKKYNPNYAGYALGGALYMGLILIGFLTGALIFIILPAIIIPKIIRKKRNANK